MQAEYDTLHAAIHRDEVNFSNENAVLRLLNVAYDEYAETATRVCVSECSAAGLIPDCAKIVAAYAVGLTYAGRKAADLIRGEEIAKSNLNVITLFGTLSFCIRPALGNADYNKVAALLVCVRRGIMPHICSMYLWYHCYAVSGRHDCRSPIANRREIAYIIEWARDKGANFPA